LQPKARAQDVGIDILGSNAISPWSITNTAARYLRQPNRLFSDSDHREVEIELVLRGFEILVEAQASTHRG